MAKKHVVDLDNLFTIHEASELLGRSEYCLWYHATKNLHPKPITKGKNIWLTRDQLKTIVGRMKLRPEETREGLLLKVENAKAA